MKSDTIIILGAGMAGIGAADRLRESRVKCLILEQQSGPGGLIRTDQVGRFAFDRAGHFVHTRTQTFAQVVRDCGVQFQTLERRSAVLLGDTVVPYPLQYNLWAAPRQIANDVAQELDDLPMSLDWELSFDDALEHLWGHTLTNCFFRPYHEKMWRLPLGELPIDWAADFVPKRDLDLIKFGLDNSVAGYGYNATFLYPMSGRIGEFAEAMAKPFARQIKLDTEVVGLHLTTGERYVRLANGEQIPFSSLISTIPLPRLLSMVGYESPKADLFKSSNLINLRIGFRGELLRTEHWYYVPDRSAPFFRVGIPSSVIPGTTPDGCHSLSLEYGVGAATSLTGDSHTFAVEALDYLAARGILKWESIEAVGTHLIAPAYVANRLSTTPQLQQYVRELEEQNLFTAGRWGGWDYLSLEQAYLSGRDAADRLLNGTRESERPQRELENLSR